MPEGARVLLTLGGLFLAGLLTDVVARHAPVPRVTLMLIVGFVAGPEVLDLLSDFSEQWFPILTELALVMIGFLLGQKVTPQSLRECGKSVLAMSVGEVLVTSSLVFLVLLTVGVQFEIALLLGGIAPASAPAATVDVVRESRAKGGFTQNLLSIVAVDDAWGLLIFSFALSIAHGVTGQGAALDSLLHGLWEVGGAIVVGIVIGVPMAFLTGRIQEGEPTQAEALGLVDSS